MLSTVVDPVILYLLHECPIIELVYQSWQRPPDCSDDCGGYSGTPLVHSIERRAVLLYELQNSSSRGSQ